MRRYVLLLAATVLMAAALGWAARRPRPDRAALAAPVPQITFYLSVREEGLTPGVGSVPKDHRIDLRVRNASGRVVHLVLSGYEDRVAFPALAPGDSLRTEFLADRPGDDFVWLVDGRPAGRLQVLGSHLVEGHR